MKLVPPPHLSEKHTQTHTDTQVHKQTQHADKHTRTQKNKHTNASTHTHTRKNKHTNTHKHKHTQKHEHLKYIQPANTTVFSFCFFLINVFSFDVDLDLISLKQILACLH